MPQLDAVWRGPAAARRLLFVDDPDPRALQTAFTLLFTLDLTLRYAGPRSLDLSTWPVAGEVLAVAGCVLAWAVPWRRSAPVAVALLPVLDVATLGMSRLDTLVAGPGILVVVPALWLGRQLGRTGAVVVTVATALLLALPGIVYFGLDGVTASRGLMIVIVAGWSSFAVAFALERFRSVAEEAEQGRAELGEALAIIEHQRRMSEAILDTVDVGLVLLDAEGRYAAMNRRHQAFMRIGYPDGHAGRAGQTGEVYAEDGRTPLTRERMPTHRASLGEEFDDVRLWIGRDAGTNRAVSVSARSVRGADGRVTGAALAYNDVTDLMQALRVKDEFVASVSHELRTPLTSIAGYVSILLEREDLPDEVVRQLAVVERNSDRLRRLVADLLETAQSDQGPTPLVRGVGDMAAIVRHSATAATPSAEAAGLVLVVEAPEHLPVRMDEQRMAQVVDNLVSNAVKYTPAGGRVEVRLGADADRMELAVTDTGIGIAAADREQLFTRFFRAREAEERSIQGVGLGLSITLSIVEAHGGRIEVESEVGAGTTFRVRLPLGVDVAPRPR